MTGEEGRSNPQIVVNEHRSEQWSAEQPQSEKPPRLARWKRGKVLTQSPESHRTENHLPRGERRRGERVNRDGGRRSPQRRKIEKGEGLLANSELANGGGLSLEVKSKINK